MSLSLLLLSLFLPPSAFSLPQLQKDSLPRVYLGPKSPAERTAWLEAMKKAREHDQKVIRDRISRMNLPYPSIYEQMDLDWMLLPQTKIMVHDRCFYDPETQQYTPGKCLDDYEARYGGVGRVLIWPAYPNIGVDNRNQFDYLRDLPGGLDALRKAIDEIHRRGIKVCLPFNPWDTGTRDEGAPMEEAMASMLLALNADCLFADTMIGPDKKFFEATLRKGKIIALEPELGFLEGDDEDDVGKEKDRLESIHFAPMSWSYVSDGEGNFPFVPAVERFKWIEPRHTPCVTFRQEQDHTNSLQFAFFNGICFNAWENIFGEWNGMRERDAEALRRIATIYKALPRFFRSNDWEPHYPTLQHGIFASRFPLPEGTIFTLVNRHKSKGKEGSQIRLPFRGQRFFDLWNGTELTPLVKQGTATLRFPMEAGGFGAVFVLPQGAALEHALVQLLPKMRELSRRKLDSYNAEWKSPKQTMVSTGRTIPYQKAPAGMFLVPGSHSYLFQSKGMIIEQYNVSGVQFPWEKEADSDHEKRLRIPAFYLDRNLVTNGDFEHFMKASGYSPEGKDQHNFLKHWPAPSKESVRWVSLEDARAYCSWAGKRLPNDWEWQYAAEKGGSSGLKEMSGKLWQWTNEFRDAGNRRALLRGGSSFCPQGSMWYFPRTTEHEEGKSNGNGCSPTRNREHGTYLLMAPSLDRAETIGFRCAADSAGTTK